MESGILYRYLNSVNKKWIVAALAVWILSFFINVWPFVFLALFCLLNMALMLYDRYVEIPIDIELSTLSAILMTLRFGLIWGIAAAICTKTAAMISNRDFNKNSIVAMGGYVSAAFLANLMHGLPLVVMGMLIFLLVNMLSGLLFRFVLFLSTFEVAMYTVSNMIFNSVIVLGFGEVLLKIIGVH
jgi:hypothetical protein